MKLIAKTLPLIDQALLVFRGSREESQVVRLLQGAYFLAGEQRRALLELHRVQPRDEVADEQDVERARDSTPPSRVPIKISKGAS